MKQVQEGKSKADRGGELDTHKKAGMPSQKWQ